MTILVTGADGMLGSWLCVMYPHSVVGYTHKELDITDTNQLYETILDLEPDAVINCAGITNKQSTSMDKMIDTNALAPHRIAKMCDLVGAKLVQVSTDCIYSGDRGNYVEEDESDATDSYGQTKYRGEVIYNPHLTVRTSFIGWPDPKDRGLLAWLQNNSDKSVAGYTNVLWNGLCANALADILVELAHSRQHGVIHVFGETVSKYHLLALANTVLQFDVEIVPTEEPRVNRTLSSARKDSPIVKTSLEEQLKEMKLWEKRYKEFQSLFQ